MAEHGYAWHNEKYSDNPAVKNAAAAARKNGIGLWSADNPLPPWVWRRLYGNAYQSAR
jgi:endonuclease YncB( thermonuclease family)